VWSFGHQKIVIHNLCGHLVTRRYVIYTCVFIWSPEDRSFILVWSFGHEKICHLFITLQEEAVRFNLEWRVPCIMYFRRRDITKFYDLKSMGIIVHMNINYSALWKMKYVNL